MSIFKFGTDKEERAHFVKRLTPQADKKALARVQGDEVGGLVADGAKLGFGTALGVIGGFAAAGFVINKLRSKG